MGSNETIEELMLKSDGLQSEHEAISEQVSRLTEEHLSLRPGWFGLPKARHYAIVREVRQLRKRSREIKSEHTIVFYRILTLQAKLRTETLKELLAS